MSYNESSGHTGDIRNSCFAVIVDTVDPDKKDRVQVRIVGHHEGINTPKELQWVHIDMGSRGENRGGWGVSPACYGMPETTMVEMKWDTNGWKITNRAPPTSLAQSDNKSDQYNTESKPTKKTHQLNPTNTIEVV